MAVAAGTVSATGPAAPQQTRMCPVCADDVPLDSFVFAHPDAQSDTGKHEQCKDCAQKWIAVQLSQKYTIHFDAKKTDAPASPENGDARIGIRCSRCAQCWSQAHLYRVLSDKPQLLAQLDRVMCGVSEMADYQPCPRARCPGGGVVPDSDTVSHAQCNACAQCFPITIQRGVVLAGSGDGRAPASSRPFGARLAAAAGAGVVSRDALIKPCPGCSTPIERNAGCDHITCTRCRHDFCWWCLQTRCTCTSSQRTRQALIDWSREYAGPWMALVLVALALVYGVVASADHWWFVIDAAGALVRGAVMLALEVVRALAYTSLWLIALLFLSTRWRESANPSQSLWRAPFLCVLLGWPYAWYGNDMTAESVYVLLSSAVGLALVFPLLRGRNAQPSASA